MPHRAESRNREFPAGWPEMGFAHPKTKQLDRFLSRLLEWNASAG